MVKRIEELLTKAVESLTDYLNERSSKKQEMQKQIQQQMYMQQMSAVSQQIVDTLYQVMKGVSYTNLCVVTQPVDFLFYKCNQFQNGYIFYFGMLKNTQNTTAPTILKSIQKKMNASISYAQQVLYRHYGDQALAMYPLLYAGMQIVSVQEISVTEMVIGIFIP